MTDEASKRRLRICLVGPAYPYRGGISHYNTVLAQKLSCSHDVYSINFKRLYPDFLFPGRTQYDESGEALSVPSERLIDSVNPISWVRAGFHIASLGCDVVIFQWWHPFFAPAYFKISAILRVFSKAKIIFLCHNVIPHEHSLIDRVFLSLAFTLPHGFLVQSREDEENLRRLRKGAVVSFHPHPIYDFFNRGEVTQSEARERIGAGRDEIILLFFGYIRPYKGLKVLLRAMPRIREKIDARLFVVGEFYEDRAPYVELIDELGIGNYVELVDRYVPNEEVEPFFVASDLVVLPYLSATQSGIVQVAMAFDKPVVVTDVGGLPDVVADGKTGFVVPAGDDTALADAVTRFFEEGWGERMARCFPEEKTRFLWEHLISDLERLIERIR
ncbi:MAG: hypothetical protein B6D63_02000 [Candidatus Latescibacteria bacterium 4484_7]|nr:MAG: hypothetical protein B6D63_02000 [Candidatus Latescibacteria bacterium 4484_7]